MYRRITTPYRRSADSPPHHPLMNIQIVRFRTKRYPDNLIELITSLLPIGYLLYVFSETPRIRYKLTKRT